MGQTAFPFESVLDVTPLTLLGNNTGSVSAAKALTPSQGRALLDVYSAGQTDTLLAAKAAASHTHLQSDVTGLTTALAAKADLVDGRVPTNQLPSFVDDVLEYASLAAFPATGESGKIYVALDTSRTYRWGGSSYIELTDSTAVWGSISGVLANQTDLVTALAGKSDTGHTHAYSSLTGIPSTFAPSAHGHAASDILSGTLDVARLPIGTTVSTVCAGDDSRLSDARTPVAHKASHATGQPDALSPSDIGAVPTARTLTINGTALDLSADRAWTVSGGINSLNGLTDVTQTFQVGTTGTDFAISSATGVHTFNLPDASTTARGVVTTGTQSIAGIKTFTAADIRGGTTQTFRLYIASSQLILNTNVSVMVFSNSAGGLFELYTISPEARFTANLRFGQFGNQVDFTPDASDVHAQRRGTVAQTSRLYSTYTSATSYERLTLQFTTYASARYAQIACESAGTGIANMNLVLSPKGTGALIVGPVPDGTATGGNARGANSVDLQTVRTAAGQVASGASSTVLGGRRATASGQSSIVFGEDATASGANAVAFGSYCRASSFASIAIGINSNASGNQAIAIGAGNGSVASGQNAIAIGADAMANRHGMYAYATGSFSSAEGSGDAQEVKWILRNKTTDGVTAVTLFANGSSARLTIPSGKILFATAQVVGSKSDGTAVATYLRKFAIKNVGGTTTLVGSVETIGTDVDAGTSLSITADDTNDAVNPAVIGVAGETWRWVMVVYGVELAYGT